MRCICCDRDFEPAEERMIRFPTCTDCSQAIDEDWGAFVRYIQRVREALAAPASEREEGGKG